MSSKSSLKKISRRNSIYKNINDKISSNNFLYSMIVCGLILGISLSVFLGIYLPKE